MQFIKTRKNMAEFLAQRNWADYPLAMEQDSAGRLIIRSSGGKGLCRYDYELADFAAEMGRLSRIIARLNGFYTAAGNMLLRPSAEEAARFQAAMRRAWDTKLKGKDKSAAVIHKGKVPRWAVLKGGPKMKESTILDKAVKTGLSDELALALLGRIIKAGIMPLALVTYGKTDYDLRYRADFARLNKFLQMQPAKLEALLSPPAAAAGAGEDAAFPFDWPIVQDTPPAEGEMAKADEELQTGAADFSGKSLAAAGNAAASGGESGGAYGPEKNQNGEAVLGRRGKDWSSAPGLGRENSPESGRDGGNKPGQGYDGESQPDAGMNAGGKNGWDLLGPGSKKELSMEAGYDGRRKGNSGIGGLDEDAPPSLTPPPRPAGSGIVTPYPPAPKADEAIKAHVIGTQKHNAINQKLRRELSPVILTYKDLYECKKRIKFTKEDGDFNPKELRAINGIMKALQGADFILVEYSVPAAEQMQGQNKKIDLAAFYKKQGLLRIVDWKFGSNYVPIDKNEQLRAYAHCLLKYVFPPSNVREIEKVIIQPNSEDGKKTTHTYL